MSDNAERRERLRVDVDARLFEIWTLIWGSRLDVLVDDDEEALDQLGTVLRAAYGVGYRDAMREEREGRRGELARANGYTKEKA